MRHTRTTTIILDARTDLGVVARAQGVSRAEFIRTQLRRALEQYRPHPKPRSAGVVARRLRERGDERELFRALERYNTAPCSDGNACTTNDRCSEGRCVGGPSPNCDDGNICTTDTCDQATGCVHTNNTAPCDDGNVCTTNDACRGGGCVGGPALNCDDGNACTDDTCNPATGCVHTNNTAPCSDGNTCTVGDVCSGGRCVPGATCGFVAGQ